MLEETLEKIDVTESMPPITGEMLFKMGNIGQAELVRGEIIPMSPTGYLHGFLESNFDRMLGAFVYKHKLGRVFVGEVGIYTRRNPDTVRAADVAFISTERMAQVKSASYLDVPPNLIVEILSPDDSWGDLMEKLEEYFNIGVEMVWIADPRRQMVFVYHSLTQVERFHGADELSGGQVLPGFKVVVAELFTVE